jgi:hypothetical protein
VKATAYKIKARTYKTKAAACIKGVFMSNGFIPASEAEFLTFATAFNAGTVAHAKLLGIPAALVTDNTAKLRAPIPPLITLRRPPMRAS